MKHVYYYQTVLGKIGIVEENKAITNLFLEESIVLKDAVHQETSLLKEAGQQLVEYFAGNRTEFDLPLAPVGTSFQKRVWEALRQIPYSETRSYSEVAKSIDQPNAARAVGMANHRNPIMVVVPCHRVIGANGKLCGYAGGIAVKEHLLKLEKANAKEQ